jgi:hypothetical protein
MLKCPLVLTVYRYVEQGQQWGNKGGRRATGPCHLRSSLSGIKGMGSMLESEGMAGRDEAPAAVCMPKAATFAGADPASPGCKCLDCRRCVCSVMQIAVRGQNHSWRGSNGDGQGRAGVQAMAQETKAHQGLGFRVSGLGFRVSGLGFRAGDQGTRGFRV